MKLAIKQDLILRELSINAFTANKPAQLTAVSRLPYYEQTCVLLKGENTIGSCQRLAFTVGVSEHMHNI